MGRGSDIYWAGSHESSPIHSPKTYKFRNQDLGLPSVSLPPPAFRGFPSAGKEGTSFALEKIMVKGRQGERVRFRQITSNLRVRTCIKFALPIPPQLRLLTLTSNSLQALRAGNRPRIQEVIVFSYHSMLSLFELMLALTFIVMQLLKIFDSPEGNVCSVQFQNSLNPDLVLSRVFSSLL